MKSHEKWETGYPNWIRRSLLHIDKPHHSNNPIVFYSLLSFPVPTLRNETLTHHLRRVKIKLVTNQSQSTSAARSLQTFSCIIPKICPISPQSGRQFVSLPNECRMCLQTKARHAGASVGLRAEFGAFLNLICPNEKRTQG
jgi:hypothetical protein